MAIQFKKAVKYDAKGRIALVGPAGSGKSFTSLELGRLLAGDGGKVAAVDTEHGSLSKYADLFDFDVIELSSYTPENFMAAIDAAERGGYSVFIADSLSHFWMGRDGALEFVDMAAKRHKDQMGGWKEFRPHERAMVDRMIASPLHIIVTMRTKTEYAEEIDQRTGKKKRVKIGLQPVQREGLEYEFDLVGYMDEDNTFIVDKTRCPHYSAKAISKPRSKEFEPFRDWLKGVKREEPAAMLTQPGEVPPLPVKVGTNQSEKPWRTHGEMKARYAELKDQADSLNSAGIYSSALKDYGIERPDQFSDPNKALECYRKIEARLAAVEQMAQEEVA